MSRGWGGGAGEPVDGAVDFREKIMIVLYHREMKRKILKL
jgi:hypothetical protein